MQIHSVFPAKFSSGLARGIAHKACCVRLWVFASETIASDRVTRSGVLCEGDGVAAEFRREEWDVGEVKGVPMKGLRELRCLCILR